MSLDYYGLCPVCHERPVILNVGRMHYGCCQDHAVFWLVGENLFSAWHDESPTSWERNRAFLRACRRVEPYYLPEPTREAIERGGLA